MRYECPNASAVAVIYLIERTVFVYLQDDQVLRSAAKSHPIALSGFNFDLLLAQLRIASSGGWRHEREPVVVSCKSLTNASNHMAVWCERAAQHLLKLGNYGVEP